MITSTIYNKVYGQVKGFLPFCLFAFLLLSFLTSCSSTKHVPEDDQLFVGLKKIQYDNYEPGSHATTTQEELEAALATAPNGALFGSSYYRTPFAPSLWVWNTFSGKESGFARWMTSSFGKAPVLMSWVNPALRASVAQSVLRKHGYFHGTVGYDVVTKKNPKKAKIAYKVNMGELFTIDTLQYLGFPQKADSLIQATEEDADLHSGDPFDVSTLDSERTRLTTLFRNNGFYYYDNGYASYLADTLSVPGKVQLRLQMADDVPDEAKHQWYIGRININMRNANSLQRAANSRQRTLYTDSTVRRSFTVRYNGKTPPLRPRVIMADMKLRPRQLYSYDKYLESVAKINAMGLFSMIDVQLTPRMRGPMGQALGDTLDVTLNCTFEKPYDFYVETNFNARTIGRMGPELKLGLTRRNAFHGGEKIDINLHGSYEWSTSSGSDMNNYEYGADAQIEFPRIIAPFFGGNSTPRRDKDGRRIRRRRFYSTPSTLAKVSANIIRRPGYFKMHVNSGEWTYRWQPSETSRHEFSPLIIKYQYMNSSTDKLDSMLIDNMYLASMMDDYCIPEMRYTYIYQSPRATHRNPIRWEISIAEAGNITSLGIMALGKGTWNELNKKLFKNPYSQFLRLETDFTKTWTLDQQSKLVAHANAGIIWTYANCNMPPFSELFYVGGANSLRAWPVRSIGPGRYEDIFDDRQASYVIQNGDLKLLFNLEYRRQLFGNLYGALFLDMGNVWYINKFMNDGMEGNNPFNFRFGHLLEDLALNTGFGLRYDLEFLVLRLDWGFGLHVPYKTTKSGYFNVDSFRKNQTLSFAIGYPF